MPESFVFFRAKLLFFASLLFVAPILFTVISSHVASSASLAFLLTLPQSTQSSSVNRPENGTTSSAATTNMRPIEEDSHHEDALVLDSETEKILLLDEREVDEFRDFYPKIKGRQCVVPTYGNAEISREALQ